MLNNLRASIMILALLSYDTQCQIIMFYVLVVVYGFVFEMLKANIKHGCCVVPTNRFDHC